MKKKIFTSIVLTFAFALSLMPTASAATNRYTIDTFEKIDSKFASFCWESNYDIKEDPILKDPKFNFNVDDTTAPNIGVPNNNSLRMKIDATKSGWFGARCNIEEVRVFDANAKGSFDAKLEFYMKASTNADVWMNMIVKDMTFTTEFKISTKWQKISIPIKNFLCENKGDEGKTIAQVYKDKNWNEAYFSRTRFGASMNEGKAFVGTIWIDEFSMVGTDLKTTKSDYGRDLRSEKQTTVFDEDKKPDTPSSNPSSDTPSTSSTPSEEVPSNSDTDSESSSNSEETPSDISSTDSSSSDDGKDTSSKTSSDEQSKPTDTKEKSGSALPIIITVIAIVVLAGGGACAYFFYFKKKIKK